ncbi:MAG: DNA polymerase Y family protein [Proteobacteria bacterium]|jgi:protein ImuB|nr:DNA polymerase Y family protein [Pseudomonadota bacterium]
MRRSIRTTELALTNADKSARSGYRAESRSGHDGAGYPRLSPNISGPSSASGLPFAEQPELADASTSTEPVWLAVYLPDIGLDVCDFEQADKPKVVTEQQHGQSIVYSVCEFAFEMGITPGMKLLSAQALCVDLQACERQAEKEQQYLVNLAEHLQVFTPMISVEQPDAVLLEVRDSVKLFGGLSALSDSLEANLKTREKFRFVLAGAPAPEASLMLARAGQSILVTEAAAIKTALGSLPVVCLPLKGVLKNIERGLQKLQNMGVDTLQDLWRLPLPGLRERFGDDFVALLERIQGKILDRRQAHKNKPCFSQSLELESEADSRCWLNQACELLLEQLCDWLTSINAVTSQMEFIFLHNGRVIECMKIGNRQGSAHKSQWRPLLELYLERQTLSEPVNQLQLHSQHVYPEHLQNLDLFRQATLAGRDDWSTTLAELSVRLGESHLIFLDTRPDYRPEKQLALFSSEAVEAGKPTNHATDNLKDSRPCWLLDSAQRLGKLLRGWPAGYERISGPERIESGWWDEDDMRRDYYVVQDTQSRHAWIYRDLESHEWFLHGLFA